METIVHDDTDDIPVFSLDEVQMKDETNNNMDFSELQYLEQDSILSAQEPETYNQYDPIELYEVIQNKLTDPFCVEVGRKRNEEGIGLRGRRQRGSCPKQRQRVPDCCASFHERSDPSHPSPLSMGCPPRRKKNVPENSQGLVLARASSRLLRNGHQMPAMRKEPDKDAKNVE